MGIAELISLRPAISCTARYRSRRPKVFCKEAFLEISQSSQENTCARVSFSIKLPETCNFIKKVTLAQVFSCEFCETSEDSFFTEHLQISLIFEGYPEWPELCPVKTLLNYLDIRLTRSSHPALFISTTKTFQPVSRDIIARWIKNTMKEANIDRSSHPEVFWKNGVFRHFAKFIGKHLC